MKSFHGGIIGTNRKEEAREPSEKYSLIESIHIIVQTHKHTQAFVPTHSHQCTIMLVPTAQVCTYTHRHALSHMCIHSCAHSSTQVHKLAHMSMNSTSLVFEALDSVHWKLPLFQHFNPPFIAKMLYSPGEMNMVATSTISQVRKCLAVGLIPVVFIYNVLFLPASESSLGGIRGLPDWSSIS